MAAHKRRVATTPAPDTPTAADNPADHKRRKVDKKLRTPREIVHVGTDSDVVNVLPFELLQLVFAYCNARTRMVVIPAVCHRWLDVGRDARQVVIDLRWAARGGECDVTDVGLKALAARFPHASTVNLALCTKVTDAELASVIAAWPDLTDADVCCSKTTHGWTDELSRVWSLGIRFYANMTDAGLGKVVAKWPGPSVNRLDFWSCKKITDAGLAMVAAGCPNLKHLNLGAANSGKVTSVGLAKIATSCSRLERLVVNGGAMLTDAGLAEVAKCANLRHLDASNCKNVTDAGLGLLAAGCPKLEQLVVYSCNSLGRQGFGPVPGGWGAGQPLNYTFPSLTHLDLANCKHVTDFVLGRMAQGLPALEHLDVSYCKQLGTHGIQYIARDCSNLTHLALAGCWRITNAVLEKVTASASGLEHLDVTDCPRVTFVTGCPTLRHLNLTNCHQVTDTRLGEIAASCPGLEVLVLTGCGKVTVAGLVKVGANCHNLTLLDLSESTKWRKRKLYTSTDHRYNRVEVVTSVDVGDTGLAKIVTSCPHLNPNTLVSRRKGDWFLAAVADVHPDLDHLDIVDCDEATEAGLAELIAHCPNLNRNKLMRAQERARQRDLDTLVRAQENARIAKKIRN